MAPRSSPASRSASARACSCPASVRSSPGTAVSSCRATLAWVCPCRTRKKRTSMLLHGDAGEALDPGRGTAPEGLGGDVTLLARPDGDVDLLARNLRPVGVAHDEDGD